MERRKMNRRQVLQGRFSAFLQILLLFTALNLGVLKAPLLAQEEKDLEKRIEQLERKIERLETRIQKVDKRFDDFSSLTISGFFDVSFSNYKNQPNIFKIGTFELDIEQSYENKFQVAAALVFDEDEGTYLGVGFIEYAFIGGPVPPRGRLFIDRGFHIQVGRFDVPLGNDWNYVSSVDRLTVTPPLTTSRLMEGVYNDDGIRILLSLVPINITVYSTQGVEQKYSYGGLSYGTRIGITPFRNPYTIKELKAPVFELGLSYLYDQDKSGIKSEDITAVDFESRSGGLILRSEYFLRKKVAGVEFDGYHITGGLDFDVLISFPFSLVFRYDHYQEKNNIVASYDQAASGEQDQVDSMSRGTAALNFNISNTSYLKFEYQAYTDVSERFKSDSLFSETLYYAQLVITF